MQVASRFLLVWVVVEFFPLVAIRSPAYTTMLLAWSITEVIRYSYFAVNLAYGKVPDWMLWLRYNTFFVLYPLGISSECWLVYLATGLAGKESAVFKWALIAVLAVYVPGVSRMPPLRAAIANAICRCLHFVHAYDGSKAQGSSWPEDKKED